MEKYYKNILGQIIQDEQPEMKRVIDIRFEDGYEIEGTIVYSFESLRIHEAVQFLKDNWEYLEPFLC